MYDCLKNGNAGILGYLDVGFEILVGALGTLMLHQFSVPARLYARKQQVKSGTLDCGIQHLKD